jgi:S1-C subfamily serine protease
MTKVFFAIMVGLFATFMPRASLVQDSQKGYEYYTLPTETEKDSQQIINDLLDEATTSMSVADIMEYNVTLLRNGIVDPFCAGTMVSPKHVLTALHCLANEDDTIRPYLHVKVQGKTYRAVVADYDRGNDLCLLAITDPVSLKYTTLGTAPKAGEKIFLVGSPAGVPDVVSTGIVAKEVWHSHRDFPVFIVQSAFWYGNSGGGTYNENGELVGVLVEFGPSGGGVPNFGYSVLVDSIEKFLGN